MHVLVLWQQNTLTGEAERLGAVQLSADGLWLLEAAESQRTWLLRVIDALNRDPPGDLAALRARLAARYNFSVRSA